MRTLIPILVLFGLSSLHADEDHVFASLKRTVEFNSAEEASNWKLEKFSFDDWLSAVADPKWKLLTSTQTTEFYFAAFQTGNHLIFWKLDRKAQYRSGSTGTTPRWVGGSKAVTLEHDVKYPSGGFKHSAVGMAYQIADGYKGALEIRCSAGNDGKRKQVFQAMVLWNSKAEQVGEVNR